MTTRITTAMDKHNVPIVKEAQWGHRHEVREGAPCAWSAEQGATHTLWLGEGPGKGTRPARLLKTVLYVGVDENADGNCVWEKWQIRDPLKFGAVTTVAASKDFHPTLREVAQ
jgi:hypothetical protein